MLSQGVVLSMRVMLTTLSVLCLVQYLLYKLTTLLPGHHVSRVHLCLNHHSDIKLPALQRVFEHQSHTQTLVVYKKWHIQNVRASYVGKSSIMNVT